MKKQVIGVLAIILFGSSITSASRLVEVIQFHFQYSLESGIVRYEDADIAKGDNSDLRYVLSQSDYFLKENITQLLSNSTERVENFNRYLRDGSSLTNALGYHKNNLDRELQEISKKIQNCQNQLSAANQLYKTSLNSKNENGFYSAVETAKKARSCMGEQQVNQNAVKTLLNQTQSYLTLVERRTSYLKSNQSLILKHYDILKTSLLKELYPIAVQLENQSNSL